MSASTTTVSITELLQIFPKEVWNIIIQDAQVYSKLSLVNKPFYALCQIVVTQPKDKFSKIKRKQWLDNKCTFWILPNDDLWKCKIVNKPQCNVKNFFYSIENECWQMITQHIARNTKKTDTPIVEEYELIDTIKLAKFLQVSPYIFNKQKFSQYSAEKQLSINLFISKNVLEYSVFGDLHTYQIFKFKNVHVLQVTPR